MVTNEFVHTGFPASTHLMARGMPHTSCWPVSGLADNPGEPSQSREAPVVYAHEREREALVRLPLRGQRRWVFQPWWLSDLCFPFNCADEKIGTGTNGRDCKQPQVHLYNESLATPQGAMSKTQELADRVERLLLRHEELKRTNELLEQQVASLTHERDNLRSRLNAARSRIDALLERLPVDMPVSSGRSEGDTP